MASSAQLAARKKFARASGATRRRWALKAARTRRQHASNPPEIDNRIQMGEKHLSMCRDFAKNPSEKTNKILGYSHIEWLESQPPRTLARMWHGAWMQNDNEKMRAYEELARERGVDVLNWSNPRQVSSNPELMIWSDQGGSMLPMSSNPEDLEMEDNPRKRRKKRSKRSRRRRGRSCHRVKGYRRCRKGGSRRRKGSRRRSSGKKHLKRGRRLLTWKAAVKRHGVMGAKRYRAKYGIKKLKG